jgi:Type II secretion system (T2SS), protein M subtype b
MTVADNFLTKRDRLIGSARGLLREIKTNRRAAAGLLAITVLAGGYGLLVVDDAIGATRASFIQAAQRLRRIAASAEEGEWPARAKASGALRQALETRLWPAESEGMAQANLQDWLIAAGRDSGLDKLRVKVELARPKGLPPGLYQLIATITALQTDPALIGFLARLEQEKRLLVVDRLHVRERPVPSLEMTLMAYAKLGAPGAELPK